MDNQLYSLSPLLSHPGPTAERRSTAGVSSARVSIDGVEHRISPVSVDEMRLRGSATRLNSRSSGTVLRFLIFCIVIPLSAPAPIEE